MAFYFVIGLVALFFIVNTIRLSKQNGEVAYDEIFAGIGLVTLLIVIKLAIEGRLFV